MWTSLYVICSRVWNSGGFPLHAALVERHEKGILLVGPAGSGKSTLCRRLPRPWRALSDDQALIVCDNWRRYLVHPIPTWSDYLWQRSEQTWNVEYCVSLAAIFFIEQARSDEVVPIGQGKGAILINQSAAGVYPILCYLNLKKDRELKKKIFDNGCRLVRAIPAYVLHASLNGRFWKEMEKVL